MSFVILSTGTLAGSTLRTLKTRTIVCSAVIAMLTILAGGVAVGYRIGQAASPESRGSSTAGFPPLAFDPGEPENRALIDRVGALSGRLIRLESEAAGLARQVGVIQEAEQQRDGRTAVPASAGFVESAAVAADADADADASGGPFVAAGRFPMPGFMNLGSDDFAGRLAQLAGGLDRIERTIALVAQVTSVRNLDTMAFPSRPPLTTSTITSGFGIRRDPFTQRLARHTGLDFRAPSGTPIRASAGGRVRFAGYRGAYGKTVEIDHGHGLVTRYGHTSRLYVHLGEVVLPGQLIAAVGSTGRSTGPHLHFEVLRNGTPVEPRLYLAHHGT